MTNTKNTKRALLSSVIALLVCVSMLIGTTFAWFTDSVVSSGNIIKSGKLDVEMYWAEGKEDPAATATTWKDASKDAIFDYELWEPGYTQARHLRIKNVGNLAFQYKLRFVANGIVTELADVIDVYYFADAKQLTRADVTDGEYLGTITEVLGTAKNISTKVNGTLLKDKSKDITLVLKMRESADNKYQNMTLGADFSVELVATQLAYEEDSFGKDYDEEVTMPETPYALVRPMTELTFDTAGSRLGIDLAALGVTELDVGYQFEPTDSYDTAINSDYRYWHADFVVSADNDVAAESLALAGYYTAWCSLNNDKWVALASPDKITKGTEIRLVESLPLDVTVNYEDLCFYGNDGIGFRCGAVDIDGSNAGTTLTVELRLYETYSAEEAIKLGYGNTVNQETGKYISLGTFTHVFGGEYETLADGTVLFNEEDGDVVLYDTQEVNTAEYTVPEGVTTLGNFSLSYNRNIETVKVASTVTDLGRAFDSSTSIKKVELNEGLTSISSRAFRSTTALEEVVIPSTVTVIEDNAFQKSGIKTVVIPATVETIGETAYGASLVETVIFEGNTSVQGYAFRGCTKLREVYFNGDDNTFIPSTLNGRNSTWFCNNESNNKKVNNITFYVKNDTVASRIKTAMGVGSLYIIKIEGGETYAYAAGKVNYTMPENVDLRGKTITIAGDKDTVIDVSNINANNQFVTGATLTFEGVTLNFGVDNYMGFANTASLTYKNCNINGLQFLYGQNVTFENCTLDATANTKEPHAAWTYGAENVSFKNCTIKYKGRAINCYTESGAIDVNVKFDNCKFIDSASGVAPVEINSSAMNSLNVTFENGCSATGNVRNGELAYISKWATRSDNVTVTIDGAPFVPYVEPNN